MQHVQYPSERFQERVEELINNEDEFVVVVSQNDKRKDIIMRKMAALLSDWTDRQNPIKSGWDVFKILDFITGISQAVTDNTYRIGYEDKGDLFIYFEPTKNKAESQDMKP